MQLQQGLGLLTERHLDPSSVSSLISGFPDRWPQNLAVAFAVSMRAQLWSVLKELSFYKIRMLIMWNPLCHTWTSN
jgi:hypothetical protein